MATIRSKEDDERTRRTDTSDPSLSDSAEESDSVMPLLNLCNFGWQEKYKVVKHLLSMSG